MFSIFMSCPKGMEYLLEEEARLLGLQITAVNPQGVYGEASLAIIYQLCLWSRIANRVQLLLFNGRVYNQQTLYQLCNDYPWQTVFTADRTLAVEFHGSSGQIRNTMFGAQVVKDAIVDHYRRLQGVRPVIDRETPQIRLHAYLKDETLTVSLDLTGYSLHQRGYRLKAGLAPLKENVAAGLLIRGKWPQKAQQGFSLQDAFCGAGTIVIEAAMIAANVAPGLIRDDQSVRFWAQHQASLWEKLRAQALSQVRPFSGKLVGTDMSPQAIAMAKANAEKAGIGKLVQFEVRSLAENQAPAPQGLFIANPPYGERLSEVTQLVPLYQQLGELLHDRYQGWDAAILTSNPMLAKAVGLRAEKQYTFFNGPLECKLYLFALQPENQLKGLQAGKLSSHAQMFENRLKKNYQHLQRWAKKNQISCYRVYDADLPEYAYAIDLYNDYAVLQEYAPPASIPLHKAQARSLEVMQVVPGVLGISPQHLVIKQRKQQKGLNQYQKLSNAKQDLIVSEGEAKLKVNLSDYLDTGLFLDHRPLRLKFSQLKPGTRFLNCFCYTATASVHAALSGAITTNVDLSNTYLAWAQENFKLNQLDISRHQFVQYDCLKWLKVTKDRFDVIFLDPPSFSNSKRMTDTLDIQRDHVSLIKAAMRLLTAEGCLYFSTNLRSFKLSAEISSLFQVQDISQATIDIDFKRNQRIHQCFLIKNRV